MKQLLITITIMSFLKCFHFGGPLQVDVGAYECANKGIEYNYGASIKLDLFRLYYLLFSDSLKEDSL